MPKRVFTDEEFGSMKEDLLTEHPNMVTMTEITKKVCLPYIRRLCRGVSYIDSEVPNDILSAVLVAVCTNITTFLQPDGPDGKVNDDPDGFARWLYTIAKNATITKLRGEKRYVPIKPEEEGNLEDFSTPDVLEGLESRDEHTERLRDCLGIVMDSGSSPHIVIAWLAMCSYMTLLGLDRPADAFDRIAENLGNKSLTSIYDWLCTVGDVLPWFRIEKAADAKMRKKLDRLSPETGKKVGDMLYREFFGKKEPEYSISDWVYRMNTLIERRDSDEASDE